MSASAIAKKYGVTEATIQYHLKRHKKKKKEKAS